MTGPCSAIARFKTALNTLKYFSIGFNSQENVDRRFGMGAVAALAWLWQGACTVHVVHENEQK